MDILKAISEPPTQNFGLAQTLPKKNEKSVESVSAVTTIKPATQIQLPEQKDYDNKQHIAHTIEDINHFFQTAQRSLAFSLDDASGHMVMQIRDSQTNELIRQIPSEDVLKLAKQLDDLTGVLFKAQA